jgi:hypothetical protein
MSLNKKKTAAHIKLIGLIGLGMLLTSINFTTLAQHWTAGDSLNLEARDTVRIDQFRDNMIDYTGQDLVDASFPNSWPLFGTKTRIAIGGYVKLDYIQDFDGAYDRFQYTIQGVPVPGDGRPQQSGYMNMFARESRMNIDIRSITENGFPFRIFFEFDFWNNDRDPFFQVPRLRHFYGVAGRFLIGRTWSTGSDLYAVPITIDFAAGDAVTGSRRAQIRFEDDLGEKMKYAVALEMLEYPDIDGPDSLGKASQLLPMLAGRITRSLKSGGRIMLAASVFQLRWDGLGIISNATALGWGVSFTGREYFGRPQHFIYWMASYGQGWGSQVVSGIGAKTSATLTPGGKLETMPALNLGGGLSINILPTLSANASSYWYTIDPSSTRSGDMLKGGFANHVNLIWSPLKKVNTGIEFMFLKRVNTDDRSGTGKRLQLMVKYLF